MNKSCINNNCVRDISILGLAEETKWISSEFSSKRFLFAIQLIWIRQFVRNENDSVRQTCVDTKTGNFMQNLSVLRKVLIIEVESHSVINRTILITKRVCSLIIKNKVRNKQTKTKLIIKLRQRENKNAFFFSISLFSHVKMNRIWKKKIDWIFNWNREKSESSV